MCLIPRAWKMWANTRLRLPLRRTTKAASPWLIALTPRVPAYLRLLPLRKALRSLGKSRKPRPQVIKCSTAQTRTLRKTTRPLPSARTAPPLRAWASWRLRKSIMFVYALTKPSNSAARVWNCILVGARPRAWPLRNNETSRRLLPPAFLFLFRNQCFIS